MKNKQILIGGFIGLIIAILQSIVYLIYNSIWSTNFITYVLLPACVLIFIGGFLGYILKLKYYRTFKFYFILLLITAVINFFTMAVKEITFSNSVFSFVMLSLPSFMSLVWIYMGLMVASAVTYGFAFLVVILISILIVYFGLKEIKKRRVKVIMAILTILQFFLLVLAIMMRTDTFPHW